VIVALDGGGTIHASVDGGVADAPPWRPGDGIIAGWRAADCHPLEPDP
jgi:hypothetical protein